jgi:flagellar motor protein MotB
MLQYGINPRQIAIVEGRGETQLLNKCDDQTPCSEAENEINRRVELSLMMPDARPRK